MKKIILFTMVLFTCFIASGQNKQTQIVYNFLEFQPTVKELAEAFNLNQRFNIDSLTKIYDPGSVNESGVVTGTLQASRGEDGIVYKIKKRADTLISEFEVMTKQNRNIFYFKKKNNEGIDTVIIKTSYSSTDDEYFIYGYKYEMTGNRMMISGYDCEQVMITEMVSSKFDGSRQERHSNVWVTDKISPSIPIQSILLFHQDILPKYTLIEAVRSPYGPSPHVFTISKIN